MLRSGYQSFGNYRDILFSLYELTGPFSDAYPRRGFVQQFRAEVPKQRYVGGKWGLCHNLSGNANDHAVMILHRGG